MLVTLFIILLLWIALGALMRISWRRYHRLREQEQKAVASYFNLIVEREGAEMKELFDKVRDEITKDGEI